MPTLLSLEVSPRGDRSISRALGKRFIEYWKSNNPDGQVISRDLNATRIPYLDNDWIEGVYAPPSVPRTPEMQRALAAEPLTRNQRWTAKQFHPAQTRTSERTRNC